MKIKRKYRLIIVVLLLGFIGACTKSVVRANKLTKQQRWVFTQLDIGSTKVTQFPKWDLPNEPIDKEFVQGTWTHHDGSSCKFLWRFDYYEGTFSFKVDANVSQDENAKAYLQCNNLSGSYKVITEKNKLFEFETYEAKSYQGVRVFIQIQPL